MKESAEILFVIEEATEDGYVARGVGADIFTEADSLDELRANVREAVECHFLDVGVEAKNEGKISALASARGKNAAA